MSSRTAIAFCLLLICIQAFPYSEKEVERYVEEHKAIALANEKEYGIPAPVTLAQGILESGAGTSGLTKASNNHFGIKAGASWTGTVYRAWDDETQKSKFRCYSSAEESYKDHAALLTSLSCYQSLFKINVYDYRSWALGLKKAGYATAPNYAQALIGIIEHFKLYALNGGAKLRPGKTVVITRFIDVVNPVIEEECIMPEEETSEEETMVAQAVIGYAVEINQVRCTVLQPGEDLASIARKYNISPAMLCSYNEIGSQRQIQEGYIIYLDKKKKKFEGTQDTFICNKDMVLHDVAQLFGIQTKYLARINKMSEYALLDKGTRIYLK